MSAPIKRSVILTRLIKPKKSIKKNEKTSIKFIYTRNLVINLVVIKLIITAELRTIPKINNKRPSSRARSGLCNNKNVNERLPTDIIINEVVL